MERLKAFGTCLGFAVLYYLASCGAWCWAAGLEEGSVGRGVLNYSGYAARGFAILFAVMSVVVAAVGPEEEREC